MRIDHGLLGHDPHNGTGVSEQPATVCSDCVLFTTRFASRAVVFFSAAPAGTWLALFSFRGATGARQLTTTVVPSIPLRRHAADCEFEKRLREEDS